MPSAFPNRVPEDLCYNLSLAAASAARLVPAELQAKRFFVSGFVHGVGFRFFAARAANRLGVSGYVRNLRDARVEVYAIGAPDQLASLKAELKRGPFVASVEAVAEEPAEVIAGYSKGFAIEQTE